VIKSLLREYKYYILAPVILIVLATIVVVVLAKGPQMGAFVYQIF
jgi:hypothetical protein